MIRHRFAEAFFDQIDSEAKAYWLGFLAGDGTIYRNRLRLALQVRDEGHLRMFLSALGATHRLYRNPRVASVEIGIRSARLVNALGRFGIVPRKTGRLRWPRLGEPWLRHFLRGCVDADGGWYVSPPDLLFRLAGNRAFLAGAQRYLMAACGVRQTKLLPGKGTWVLAYTGNRQGARIARLLYNGATVYLERKHRIVLPFLS